MPKTKDAFAFRNFDKTRILQRPYFRRFNLPNKSDVEIIQSLQAADDDSVDTMEDKLSTLKALHERVQDFQSLCSRHIARISSLVKKREKENKKLPYVLEYVIVVDDLGDILNGLAENYYVLEKKIQKKYRDEFTARLRHYLEESGLTRRKLGDLVQVSPQSMSKYFLGQNEMPIHTLIRISKVLGISTDKLLGLG